MEFKQIQFAGTDVTFSVPTASRSELQVRAKVDCRDRLRIDAIESLKKDLMDGSLHYAIILYQGAKDAIIDEKIEEIRKARGFTIPIITTVPLSRREIDVLLLNNIAGDAIEKEDNDKIMVYDLKGEMARIRGKIENLIESFLGRTTEEGLIVPEYDITKDDITCLICFSTVLEESLVDTYVFVSGERERAMIKIEQSKKRLKDAKLLTHDNRISISPFLNRAISAVQEKGRISGASEIAKKFLLANVDDLNNWLEFLNDTGILRKENESYLLCYLDYIKEELTKLHVQDPSDIDQTDKYGGTLRNFLAAYNYEKNRKLLEEWCDALQDSLAKPGTEKNASTEWMTNINLRYTCLRQGLLALDGLIQRARQDRENSRKVMENAESKLENYEARIEKLNEIIDEAKG